MPVETPYVRLHSGTVGDALTASSDESKVRLVFGVFLCYRRTDNDVARRLKDYFTERGISGVFLDVDASHWGYGQDFRTIIRETIAIVSVVVVLVSPGNWAKRLSEENDIVRLELREALRGEWKLVVPVLVDGATMPQPFEFPREIADFAQSEYIVRLRTDHQFNHDAERLFLGVGMVMAEWKGQEDGWDFIPETGKFTARRDRFL